MSLQTPHLDLVMLYVSSLDEASRYFTEKLGFHLLPEESGPDFHQLRGDGGIDFALLQASSETAPAGSVHLYFKTPNLEGTRETYIERGVQATPIMHMPFGNIFDVDAPDKLLVTLIGAA